MAHDYRTRRIVEFAETDMAGLLHFSNYFRYMEAAEHAFFRSLGMRVHAPDDDGVFGWARGRVDCVYHRPLRYEDVVELHVEVVDKRSKSITYAVTFRKCEGLDGPVEPTVIARGSMTVVCIARSADGTLRATAMPPEVDAKIEAGPSAE